MNAQQTVIRCWDDASSMKSLSWSTVSTENEVPDRELVAIEALKSENEATVKALKSENEATVKALKSDNEALKSEIKALKALNKKLVAYKSRGEESECQGYL